MDDQMCVRGDKPSVRRWKQRNDRWLPPVRFPIARYLSFDPGRNSVSSDVPESFQRYAIRRLPRLRSRRQPDLAPVFRIDRDRLNLERSSRAGNLNERRGLNWLVKPQQNMTPVRRAGRLKSRREGIPERHPKSTEPNPIRSRR